MDLVAPYSFIPKYKGLAALNELKEIENKTGDEVKTTTLPIWKSLLSEARTAFEQELMLL
ncbi:MAG: hypothetical protein ACYDEC_15610 [Bacteroidia bacterium]